MKSEEILESPAISKLRVEKIASLEQTAKMIKVATEQRQKDLEAFEKGLNAGKKVVNLRQLQDVINRGNFTYDHNGGILATKHVNPDALPKIVNEGQGVVAPDLSVVKKRPFSARPPVGKTQQKKPRVQSAHVIQHR